jgi:hypothetical protein
VLGDIYKRLLDENSIMGINTDPPILQLPLIKAQAVLLLSKAWTPTLMDSKVTEAQA